MKTFGISVINGAILLLAMIVLCESDLNAKWRGRDVSGVPSVFKKKKCEGILVWKCEMWIFACSCRIPIFRKKKSGCLLGTSEIRMADFSVKQVKDVKKGDKILDGKLQVAEVQQLGFIYADQDTQLFTFGSNGPIFSADHEFFVNFDDKLAVQSLPALIASDPEQALSTTIKEFKDVKTLLKLDDSSHKIVPSTFTVQPYRGKLSQNTKLYNLISSGASNSYIVNDFVSHEDYPNFSAWPLTYAFLTLTVKGADLTPYAAETPETYNDLAKITQNVCNEWKNEVLSYSTGNKKCTSNAVDFFKNNRHPKFEFDYILKYVLNSNLRINFAMDLNRCSAGFLHTVLDNEKYTDEEKNCLLNNLMEATGDQF